MSILSFGLFIVREIADPNDWVNVDYIVQRKGAVDRSTTVNAQTSIINGASSTAKRGPWSRLLFMYLIREHTN